MLQYNYCATVHYKSEISYIKRIMMSSIVYHAIYSTGSRGDLFVVRTSKPVDNLRLSVWGKKSKEREGKGERGGGAFRSRSAYSVLRASVVLRATCRAPARIWLAVIDFQNGEQQSRSGSVYHLGQIRSEEMVYSRFTKIPLG